MGKKVWLFGATAEWEGAKYGWNPVDPATVVSVDQLPTGRVFARPRIWVPLADAAEGTVLPEPFRFRLRVKGAVDADKAGREDPNIALLSISTYKGGKERSVDVVVASGEEFGRWVALTPPDPSLRRCGAGIRRAFVHRKIVRGMPKDLVVRLTGFPIRETPTDPQWRLRLWDFDCVTPTPFTYQINFDRRGRVVKVGSAGELP